MLINSINHKTHFIYKSITLVLYCCLQQQQQQHPLPAPLPPQKKQTNKKQQQKKQFYSHKISHTCRHFNIE